MTASAKAIAFRRLTRRALSIGVIKASDKASQFLLPVILVRCLDTATFGEYRLLWLLVGTVLTLATPAFAAPAEDVGRLAWIAGSWIEVKDGVTTRETWLPPRGGAMAGAAQTNAPGKAPSIEHAKITVEPAGVTSTALVPGQPPTPPPSLVPGRARALPLSRDPPRMPRACRSFAPLD